jgi:hypothetical protein
VKTLSVAELEVEPATPSTSSDLIERLIALERLVNAGVLTRLEAARIMNFLVEHIDRIISYHPPAV